MEQIKRRAADCTQVRRVDFGLSRLRTPSGHGLAKSTSVDATNVQLFVSEARDSMGPLNIGLKCFGN